MAPSQETRPLYEVYINYRGSGNSLLSSLQSNLPAQAICECRIYFSPVPFISSVSSQIQMQLTGRINIKGLVFMNYMRFRKNETSFKAGRRELKCLYHWESDEELICV